MPNLTTTHEFYPIFTQTVKIAATVIGMHR